MSASFYDLLKYAATGIASPSMTYYDKMRASTLMGGVVKTLTGQPPLTFKADGTPLISWSMKGNGQQTGTPTPDNPVMPTFCGVRTGNLFPQDSLTGKTSVVRDTFNEIASSIVFNNGQYTISMNITTETLTGIFRLCFTYTDDSQDKSTWITGRTPTIMFVSNGAKVVKSISITDYNAYTDIVLSNIMLNTGSTALPYEPYGYKIPFENHGENLLDIESWIVANGGEYTKDGNDYTFNTKQSMYTTPFYFSNVDIPVSISGVLENVTTSNPRFHLVHADGTIAYDTALTPFRSKTENISCAGIKFDWSKGGTVKVSELMLNLGSTPKPYSPYLNETIPVYLGEVPTVRRVRKLVLTGDENWTETAASTGRYRFYLQLDNAMTSDTSTPRSFCTHLPLGASGATYTTNNVYTIINSYIYIRLTIDYNSLSTFKAFLAAQFDAGTPMTVWFVRAEPTTAIVNEPLAKIGDYADELSSTDAAVTIPTAKGSNTLTVDTPIQPSEMSITYRG